MIYARLKCYPGRRKMSDERIEKLEILVAEHERTIEELSSQINDHWNEIDRLQKTLNALAQRFLTLEEQLAPDVPVTKPPHW